jgi:hypothetical protein
MNINSASDSIKVAIALGFGLFCCELTCRLLDFAVQPSVQSVVQGRSQDQSQAAEQLTGYQHDSEIGWINAPGLFEYEAVGRVIKKRIWPDHSRVTRLERSLPEPSPTPVVFFGDSFIEGWGLNDEETLAWHTQEALPRRNVYNYAVSAHGICQTLAMVRRTFEAQSFDRPTVIVGFGDFLIPRNLISPLMDYQRSKTYSPDSMRVPTCTLGDSGQVVVFPPNSHELARDWLSSSALLVTLYRAYLAVAFRTPQQKDIVAPIFSELKKLVERQGGRLVVIFYSFVEEQYWDEYREIVEELEIPVVDGRSPGSEYELSDGHPNAKLTKLWRERLSAYLQ